MEINKVFIYLFVSPGICTHQSLDLVSLLLSCLVLFTQHL